MCLRKVAELSTAAAAVGAGNGAVITQMSTGCP